MPQLDIDLFEDFLFFAFVSLLFGFGDDDVEENLIQNAGESYLLNFYIISKMILHTNRLVIEELTNSAASFKNKS